MNIQKGTFNTIGKSEARFGGDFPVWSRVDKLYQGGSQIDVSKFNAGDVIGAGTPVVFNGAGKVGEIVNASAYDATKTYKVGDHCENGGKLYVNKTAIETPEAFTSSKWTDITQKVNGLSFEDVCIPDGCTLATCAVVRGGRIYADRVAGAVLPKAIEANLPMIEFVREA